MASLLQPREKRANDSNTLGGEPFVALPPPPGSERRFDVIVIGSGAGGAVLAWKCAMSGKHVLLIERARSLGSLPRDERSTLVEKLPYDNRTIVLNGKSQRLYIGGTIGGSTSLYGAALLRPSLDDFHPGRYYSHRLPKYRWDWPIDYEELASHYDQAEQLFGVTSAESEDFDPLQSPGTQLNGQPIPSLRSIATWLPRAVPQDGSRFACRWRSTERRVFAVPHVLATSARTVLAEAARICCVTQPGAMVRCILSRAPKHWSFAGDSMGPSHRY